MLDLESAVDYATAAAHRTARTVTHLRLRVAGRARVAALRDICRSLILINRQLERPDERPASAVALEALRHLCTRLTQEIANPPDKAVVGYRDFEQYIAGLGRLLRECATTANKIDDETDARLEWTVRQIRLAHLQARLTLGHGDLPDLPVECDAMREAVRG